MRGEPLDFDNRTFAITRQVEQAPKHTFTRELFMNAQENATLAAEGNRKVRVHSTVLNGVSKLTFWNTGRGMNASELRAMTNFSSSIGKQMSLDGNFGIGAKVSGLAVSPAGLRYRSCKDGVVREVTIGWDEEAQTYARLPVRLEDGSVETVFEVTEAALREGHVTAFDWTEAVLIGERDDHDTVREPLGFGVAASRSYIATAIFQRFAAFLSGVDVQIETSMTKGGGKGDHGHFRTLKPFSDVLDKLPNSEKVTCPRTGIGVHYIHDPKGANHSHSASAVANPATQSTSFCALIHKGERYDFRNKKRWSAAAPSYGIPFGSSELSIEIVLPDDAALPNQYRDGLISRSDRSSILAEHYADLVRGLMPEWVQEVIRKAYPATDNDLDDLREDLQKLLDEFRVPQLALAPARARSAERAVDCETGSDRADRSDLPPHWEWEHEEECGVLTTRTHRTHRANPSNPIRLAPEGARRCREVTALARVPAINILADPEEIAAKAIKGRAGRLYQDSQTLFINGRYTAVELMAAELGAFFVGQGEAEAVRRLVLRAAQRFTALRVGRAACFAIAKRLSDDWGADDLDRATSPESLSLAADDYRHTMPMARKWVRDRLAAAALEKPEDELAA